MRTIIHDLNEKELKKLHFNSGDKVVSSLKCTNGCIGCFNCWIKHPTKCAIKDDFSNLVDYIKRSDELVIISRCRYGCYSASVKKVIERCIGYILPYFTFRNEEMHHKSRYDKELKIVCFFYGKIDEDDKKTVSQLVKRNCLNFNTNKYDIHFNKSIKEIDKCIL